MVRLRARRRRARRRDAGQGDGQRHAGRRVLGAHARSPPCSSRATTAAPTAARRSPPRRSCAVIDEMRRIDAPALAARAGAPARATACARSPVSSRCAARVCCSAPSSTDGIDAKAVYLRLPRAGPGHATRSTPTTLRFAPPLTVTRRRDRRGARTGRREVACAWTGRRREPRPARPSPTSTAGELEQILALATAPIASLGRPLAGWGRR